MENDNASMATPARSPVVRPGCEQWDITSGVTGRAYRIYVSMPEESFPPPPGGYPVFYVTDADYIFHTAADTQMMLSIGMQAKPAIIVGIGYGTGAMAATVARFTDLTPTPPGAAMIPYLEGTPMFEGATYGGAEGFYRFLTEELKTLIDTEYKTDKSDSTLWGHSLGGLFALHVLFNHAEAYKAYVIGSPSIVWNDGEILAGEAKLAASLAGGKVAPRILLTAGGLEETADNNPRLPPGMTREQLQAMLETAGVISSVKALTERLKAMNGPAGYEVETVVFDGETHISVMTALVSRGLRFALKP
ncbi:alpha/beta hydrolase [Sphingomonas sp. So64.6b]|uniref:alpha/beta hydrolase n=1 Tax=Sphingomonas sp. So64.6b TaxID=2997354 RepID=UPI001602E7F2|nr:alpha/beta hydrolase-fold protein [Sphingomonas sp. So64.6b]QNA86337.1 alpha/beta hydrolase [Sphingomonas sp. So64.6b]